jgi:hypothetical protein
MEFLVVKAACEGEDRALEAAWTPFMKELFVSWGHTEAGGHQSARAQQILSSDLGRMNVAPLFDMRLSSAVRGLPDFKRGAERQFTAAGDRLSPPSWRASSMNVFNEEGRGIINITDSDFNLTWSYRPKENSPDSASLRLVDVLKFRSALPYYRFPNYEQFVALVEGLYRIERNIIPNGSLFTLEDKPAKHQHLIVQLNSEIIDSIHLKCIDKQRNIAGTPIYLNTYLTGLTVSAGFATNIIVEQLYVEERQEISFSGELEDRSPPQRKRSDTRLFSRQRRTRR